MIAAKTCYFLAILAVNPFLSAKNAIFASKLADYGKNTERRRAGKGNQATASHR
jgi:hypothetical protein